MKEYQPRGRVAVLVDRMRQEPARILSAAECAQIMGCKLSAVSPTVEYALKARLLFKRNTGRRLEFSLTEMAGSVVLPPTKRRTKHPEQARPLEQGWTTDPDDPRIGKVVAGWRPPVMRCARLGQ